MLALLLTVFGHPVMAETAAPACPAAMTCGDHPDPAMPAHDLACADHAACALPAILPAGPALTHAGMTAIFAPADRTGSGSLLLPEPDPPRPAA